MAEKPTDIRDKQLEKKLKEAKTPGKKPKLKLADVYRTISDAINHSIASSLDHFPNRYLVTEPTRGVRLILEANADDVCSYVDAEAVVSSIMQFVQTNKKTMDNEYYKFEHKHAQSCMKLWLATAPVVPEPQMVRFKDEPGLTMCRLPWVYKPSKDPCPTFDELFGRMSNHEAAMAYIGSLFEQGSYRQQYLYIYGQGADGKGALCRFLMKVLGNAAQMLECPTNTRGQLQDKHWTSHLVGVRLGVFDDLDVYNFPATGFFKRLSGTDTVYVNPKNRRAHNAPLSTKFIFTSNRLPVLSSSKADMRRAIICEMDPPEGMEVDPLYESRMWEEGGRFLSNCIHNYRYDYPDHRPVACEVDTAEMIAEEKELPYQAAFDSHFVLDPDAELRSMDFFTRLSRENWSPSRVSEFKEWLKTKHGIKPTRPPKGHRRYKGIRLKIDGPENLYPGNKPGYSQGSSHS